MAWLETIYLLCIGVGLVYTVVTLFTGDSVTDWFHSLHLPVLQPILWVSGLTALMGSSVKLAAMWLVVPLTMVIRTSPNPFSGIVVHTRGCGRCLRRFGDRVLGALQDSRS